MSCYLGSAEGGQTGVMLRLIHPAPTPWVTAPYPPNTLRHTDKYPALLNCLPRVLATRGLVPAVAVGEKCFGPKRVVRRKKSLITKQRQKDNVPW